MRISMCRYRFHHMLTITPAASQYRATTLSMISPLSSTSVERDWFYSVFWGTSIQKMSPCRHYYRAQQISANDATGAEVLVFDTSLMRAIARADDLLTTFQPSPKPSSCRPGIFAASMSISRLIWVTRFAPHHFHTAPDFIIIFSIERFIAAFFEVTSYFQYAYAADILRPFSKLHFAIS